MALILWQLVLLAILQIQVIQAMCPPVVHVCPASPVLLTATSVKQTFQSPGYPGQYSNNLDCTWKIDSGSASAKVVLQIQKATFTLESHASCAYDSVKVLTDFTSGTVLEGPWCGTPTADEIVTSTGRFMFVKFHTDKSQTYNGFSLRYWRELPADCSDIQKSGATRSGKYLIYPDGTCPGCEVMCDLTTDGGGWTIFQSRKDGSVNFYRGWNDYRNGFGSLNTEFWLGNEKLFQLTRRLKGCKLRIDLEIHTGQTAYAKYSGFSIGDEASNYKITVGQFSGNAGDSLSGHNGMAFTTKDRDNDATTDIGNCAVLMKGAWWYHRCHSSNLNGLYGVQGDNGNSWAPWMNRHIPMKTSVMMIRPA